jgi:hypothetical protein
MSLQGRCAEGAIIADIVKYADSESSAKSEWQSSKAYLSLSDDEFLD